MTSYQRKVALIRLSALPQFIMAAFFVMSIFIAWTAREHEAPDQFVTVFVLACFYSALSEFFLVPFGGFFGFHLFHPGIRAIAIALIVSVSWGICALYGLKGLASVSPLLVMSIRAMLVMSEARGYKTVQDFYDEFMPPRFLFLFGLTVLITVSGHVLEAMGLDVFEERFELGYRPHPREPYTRSGLFDANPLIPMFICAVYHVVFGISDFRRRPPPQPPRSLLDPPVTRRT